jgi:hypothetical protein
MKKPIRDFVKGTSFTVQLNWTDGSDITGDTFILSFTNDPSNHMATKSVSTIAGNDPNDSSSVVNITVTDTFTDTFDLGEYLVHCKRVSGNKTTTIFRSGMDNTDTVTVFKDI